jgi:ornithine cyclodeaminase/alanine dehydrogenase-like protein (mu-crystallin family)
VTLLLTSRDVERVLDVDQAIEAVATAFRAYSAGKTATSLRVGVEPPGVNGVVLAMPCAVAEPAAVGTKVVSIFRDNPARGLPTLASMYLLSDYETGAAVAVMDGTYLTGLRTAAGSAVATRELARPDAHTLGVFGTGVQARFHVLTLARVRALRQVLVAATSAANADAFARWVTDMTGLGARAASVPEVSAADIVAACTTSRTPVVEAANVQPGAHVNAVGAFTPTARELPTALVRRARVYVDTRAGAYAEAGDLLLPVQEGAFRLDDVAGELGEVLLGRVPGRAAPHEVTIYKSVGAAFLDAVSARVAYERAVGAGIGQEFAFT